MKKILIAFDGVQLSKGAFAFARQLNDLHSILLTGVFMPQLTYANLWSYADGMAGAGFVPLVEPDVAKQLEQNVKRFEALCLKNNIAYSVHRDYKDFALPELKRETRFADLLIIGSETFYSQIVGDDPDNYLRDALHDAECPVLVVPENCHFPETNIIAYDGSAASVFAMKQFVYLFPELRALETVIVYSDSSGQREFPEEEQIKELAKQHFMDVSFQKPTCGSKDEFAQWVGKHKRAMLITGAYGRSGLSQWITKSFADKVITGHGLPVFIAHK